MRAEYVTGGSAAVARVEQAQKENDPFSIVIVDWKMPGTDGMETSREIKSLTGGETPIIILSAFDWSEVEQEAVSLGISGFIEKPLFKSRLVHVLKQAIGLNENAAESLKEITAGKEYKDMRVLLVEDNELNIEVAGELFNAIGIQTEVAGNGKQAVDKLSSTSPGYFDMVFMDIQMPIMNGYQAAKTIRSMKRKDLKNIPIIAMTADAFADDVRKSEEAGMNGHISKPVDIAKIKEMVDRWTVG
jgi:CheY-like chemotaxis protein